MAFEEKRKETIFPFVFFRKINQRNFFRLGSIICSDRKPDGSASHFEGGCEKEKMILESPNVDLPKLSLWFRRSFLRKWGTVIPIAFPSLLGLCLSTPPTPKKTLTRNCQVKSCRLSLKSCQRQRISTSFPRFFVLWTHPPMTIPSLEKFWLFFLLPMWRISVFINIGKSSFA